MKLRALPESGDGAFSVYDCQGHKLTEGLWQHVSDESYAIEFAMPVSRETDAWLHFASTIPAILKCRKLEIRWDVHSQIRAIYNALTTAAAHRQLHAGRPEQALALLAEAAPPCWNDLEFKRLELAALQDSAANPERCAQTARQILQAAPAYYPALNIINPDAAARLSANLPQPILYSSLLALVGVNTNLADGHAVELIFEAMDDDIPSLAAVAYHRGDRSRRRKGECLPIGPEYRKLTRGERVVVRIEDPTSPLNLSFSVQSNVRWSPGVIKPEGRRDPVIAVSELMALLPSDTKN
jgi:hypothetical protein